MRVDSYAQTPTSRGAAHKALSVLMALVLALGLMPISHGQAWAGNSKIQATMGVESTSKADNTIEGSGELNLKAKMTDFTYDGTKYLSGGYGVSYENSGLKSSDFEDFTVQWFTKAPGKSDYTATNSTSVGSDGWNSLYNCPSSSEVYQTGTKKYDKEGTYNVYCVAMDGTEEVSDRLEYTVTVTKSAEGGETVKTQALTLVVKDASGNALSTEFPYGDVEVTLKDKSGNEIYLANDGTYTVNQGETYTLNIKGDGYQNYDEEITVSTDSEYTKNVTMKTAAATSAVFTFVASNDGVDFTDNAWVELYEGENPTDDDKVSIAGAYNKFSLNFGTTYTVLAQDNDEGYELYRSTFTPTAESNTTQTITLTSASSDPEPVKYKLEADSEHGTVVFRSGNADGEVITEAAEGDIVYFEVTPDEGWTVGKDDEGELDYSYTYGSKTAWPNLMSSTFEMPAGDVTFHVPYEEKGGDGDETTYKIDTTTKVKGATITADKSEFKAGDTITLTIEPQEGLVLGVLGITLYDEYSFPYSESNGVKLDVADDGKTATVTISDDFADLIEDDMNGSMSGDIYVCASYGRPGKVTCVVTDKGSLVKYYASDTEFTAVSGDFVYFDWKPALGYYLDRNSIKVTTASGKVIDPQMYASNGGFYMPDEDVTLTADFLECEPHEITVGCGEEVSKQFGADTEFALNASCDTSDGLTYASDNENVATVDETGKVTIVGAGVATISITAPATVNNRETVKEVKLAVAEADNPFKIESKGSVEVPYGAVDVEASKLYSRSDDEAEEKAEVVFLKKSGNKNIVVNAEDGSLSIASALPVGSYPVRVLAIASGGQNMKAKPTNVDVTVKVVQADSPLEITAKPVEVTYSSSKQTIAAGKALALNMDGAVFDETTTADGIKVAADGTVTVPAGLAAKAYSVPVTAKNAATTGYKAGEAKAELKVTVNPVSIKNKKVVLESATLIYSKKAQEPVVKTVDGLKLKKGTDYTMSYNKSSVKAVGAYQLTVKGKGNYTGNAKAVTFKILNKSTLAAKAANPTVAFAKVSKAAQSAVVGSVSNVGQGTLKVTNVSTDTTAKKWKVAYNKKTKKITVTVPKKTAKNTKGYALKVKVTTAGNNTTYAPGAVTLTSKVAVK